MKQEKACGKICVVGSSNFDLIAYTDRLPKQGETIMGNSFKMGFGGKGANQAAAAAKLGATVTMVTKLGQDIFGKQTFENFKNLKINTDFIYWTEKASSGVAPIWVDKQGNNSIIVISGANDLMQEDEVEAARKEIASSNILICQNEIPMHVTKKALQIAKEEGVTTLFNPAPSPSAKLTKDFLELVDILCPNETETESILNTKLNNIEDAILAGKELIQHGVKEVILTLGHNGSLFITKNRVDHVAAYPVDALDTTGAGDCFIGSFAYFYTSGLGLSELECIRRANYVASKSVQKAGTQTSYPLASELPSELFLA